MNTRMQQKNTDADSAPQVRPDASDGPHGPHGPAGYDDARAQFELGGREGMRTGAIRAERGAILRPHDPMGATPVFDRPDPSATSRHGTPKRAKRRGGKPVSGPASPFEALNPSRPKRPESGRISLRQAYQQLTPPPRDGRSRPSHRPAAAAPAPRGPTRRPSESPGTWPGNRRSSKASPSSRSGPHPGSRPG